MFLNNLGSDQDIPMIKQSFYYFLIDVMENQTLSLVEILKSKKYCKKSMINLQKVEVAFNYAKAVFNTGDEDKLETQSNQTIQIQKNLNKNAQQKLVNQIKRSKQKVKLIETINFEQKLFEAQKQYLFCLELKKSLLDTISNDHIKLNQLDKQFQEITKQKGFLYNNLYQLVTLNYQSIELQNLCIDYESNLTNQNLIFTNFYVQNAKKMVLQYRKGLNAFYQFSKDSCVIFVSLLGNLGLVCKVSENFQDVVPIMTNEQAIGKNIGFMMPQEISTVHDLILKNFVQRGLISEGISNYPLLIGVDRNGWAIPYDVKIQVFLVSDQELGASAWLKQVSQDEYQKTLYNTFSGSNYNHAIALDKRFYDILFQDVFQQSEIQNIYFGNLAPSLMGILQKADLSREQEILFLKPKTKQDCKKTHINFSNDYSNTQTNVFFQLYQYELFVMRAELIQIKNKFTHFVQMKIKYLSKLQSTLEIRENFRILAKQLVEYQGINIEDVESHLNQFFQFHSNFLNQSKSQTILLFTKRDIQNENSSEDQEESSPPTLAKITENYEQRRSTFLKSNYTQLISQSQLQNQEIITPRNELARYYEQISSQVSLKLQTPTANKGISFMNIPMVSSKRENIPSQENMILSTNRILTPKENSKLLQYQLASTEIQTSNQISVSQEQPVKRLEKIKKKQKKYRYQQSSISSDSTKLSLFQILKRNISREKIDIKTIGLNVLSLFLVLCVILMSVLFLILSIQSQQQGLNQSKFMIFANEINSSIQDLITYKYLGKLIQNNLIQNQPNSSLISQLINLETVQTFGDYQKLISSIIFNSKDTENTILQQIVSSTMTYITEIKGNTKLSKKQNLEVSIVQTYSQLLNDFYRPPLNNLISYFTENNLNYKDELQKLQQANQNDIQNSHDQNINQLMILTILILIDWFLLIAIYNYNFTLFQKRKEETLKLFSTFSPQDLSVLLESCNQEIQKTKQQIINHKQNVLANQQNQKDLNYFKKENVKKELILSSADIQIKKRKNISSTQGLKVYNNYLICYSFLTLILIIITFVLISILQSTTIQQIQDNQKFIFSETEQNIANQLTVTSISTYCLLGQDEQNINFPNLQAEINNQISQSSSIIQLLVTEINKNNYSNQEFVQNIFENNSCQQMKLIDSTLNPKLYNFIQQQCSQIENGILQKGLVSSLKLYNQKTQSIMQILASDNYISAQIGYRFSFRKYNQQTDDILLKFL
ncbi:transmembrane protein, putative (macronuclear) [Tetrahymena thermophila SB210]|uniref:Transmembrane protein, putative n=1 Tax=Tetrahymena thermophila (strain SB210) TaxID=312017 RepID=I7MDE8_TETTS|nr:transmembrane protein, putative [Tetrahymena thermophila SB210]EAR87449.2 transmembrane protein, putative [Tetrahymena thermophila SB210]|eukprot:XP_001007694.2 transmembrane protein, putative [Tetrahymena thermophila SB210]